MWDRRLKKESVGQNGIGGGEPMFVAIEPMSGWASGILGRTLDMGMLKRGGY